MVLNKILLLGRVVPGPGTAESARMLSIVQILTNGRNDVHFGYTKELDDEEKELLKSNASIGKKNWIDKSRLEFSREKNYDMVIFQGADCEQQYGEMFKTMKKDTVRILDLFDSEGIIEQRESAYFETGLRGQELEGLAPEIKGKMAKEIVSSYKSDVVWTGSDFVKYILKEKFKAQNVLLIPPLFEEGVVLKSLERLSEVDLNRSYSGNLHYFGDFRRESEKENLRYVLEEVWPSLASRNIKMCLDLYGEGIDKSIVQLSLKNPRVRAIVNGVFNQGLPGKFKSSLNWRPKYLASINPSLCGSLIRW